MSSFGASSTDAEFLDIVRMNCQNQQQDFRDGVLVRERHFLGTEAYDTTYDYDKNGTKPPPAKAGGFGLRLKVGCFG